MVFKDILRRRAVTASSDKVLKKLTPYQILIKPLITEKSRMQLESDNKCYFQVDKAANKNDVKMSIKYIYKVEPEDVNIINVPYK
jgi:large subunit ribosomal protein L23